LESIQSKYFKTRAIRTKNRNPAWWNGDIRKIIKEKCKLFKKFKESNSEIDFDAYKRVRGELKRIIRKSKRQAEINLARYSGKDIKKFF
jgi:hypothetical protein